MKPRWIKSERVERIGQFNVNGAPHEVFPLLCPVLEYRWLPKWSCDMAFSKSGVAEKDAIFHTPVLPGKKVVWTAITYEPDSFVEYLLVLGRDAVIRLSVSLETLGTSSAVTWRMLFTTTSALGKAMVRRTFSEEKFRAMIGDREAQINHYLKTGRMIGT